MELCAQKRVRRDHRRSRRIVRKAAVNRWVDGSNPSRGATMETRGQATIALPLVFLEFRLGTIGVPPMRRLAANRRHESGRIVPGATGNITHEANQRSTPPNEGTPRPAQGETQSQAPQTAGESTRVVTRRPWQTGRGKATYRPGQAERWCRLRLPGRSRASHQVQRARSRSAVARWSGRRPVGPDRSAASRRSRWRRAPFGENRAGSGRSVKN